MRLPALIIFSAISLCGCTQEPASITFQEAQENIQQQESTTDLNELQIPRELLLEVPFTSQAPTKNWDPPYDEACEEASMLMVHSYLQGKTEITVQKADQEILNLVKYETDNNYPIDLTVLEMQEVIRDYYNYDSKILEGDDISLNNFRQLLSQGTPIIIPVAGQELNNPNFSGDGPPFHVLPLVGYNDDKQIFYAHDPGTRNGKNYTYPYNTIMNILHDWTGNKNTIKQGEAKAIIFTQPIQ